MSEFEKERRSEVLNVRLTPAESDLLGRLARVLELRGKADVVRRALDRWLDTEEGRAARRRASKP